MISSRSHVEPTSLLRSFLLVCGILCSATVLLAQWDIPERVLLDGPSPNDRQVLDLGTPEVPDALMSAGTERRTSTNYTVLQGTVALVGDLIPEPTAYTVGMMITAVPTQTNASGPTIELNGLGARPIVKSGGVPLDSADLVTGVAVRLIFDGARFQLLSSISLSCPQGFHSASREYCIADSSDTATSFFAAATACSAQGARLCTMGEWAHACSRLPGFLGTVSTAEWVDHAANNAATAKVVGAGNNGEIDVPGTGCNYGGWGLPMDPFRFRCCTDR